MIRNGMLERTEMTNGTEGGVLHLLRLTRTQCHAWVAFVALRADDGSIEITAVPGAEDESADWPLETLQGIVRQTLEDPLIGEGRAVIRVSEVFRRYWPGERQYTRMAVAPLNDVAAPGRPWGLLCALDPVDGQFSEPQLDMLGRLAVRFINHLRARRQFVDDASVSDALLSEALGDEQVERARAAVPAPEATGTIVVEGEPLPDEGILRIERAATWLTGQADPVPSGEAPAVVTEPEAVVTEPEAVVTEPEGLVEERMGEELAQPAPEAPAVGAFWREAFTGAGETAESADEEVEVVFGDAFQVATSAPIAEQPAPWAPGSGFPAEEPFGFAATAPFGAEAAVPFEAAGGTPFAASETELAAPETELAEVAEAGTFAEAPSWTVAEAVAPVEATIDVPVVHEPVVHEPGVHEPVVHVQRTTPLGGADALDAEEHAEGAVPAEIEPAEIEPVGGEPVVADAEAVSAEAGASEEAPVSAEAPAEAPRVDEGFVPVRKVRLSELVDELESTLGRLRSMQRNGAMFLVELPTELRSPTQPLQAAADRLAEATRSSDLVLAVGGDMVAVVMELGPRPAQPEAIRERLISASAGEGGATGDLRASTVGLEPQGSLSAESLVLNAVRQLGAR